MTGYSVENHLEPQARHDFHLYGWAAGPCVTRKLSFSWCEQVRSAQ
jgi:hypothetical protein